MTKKTLFIWIFLLIFGLSSMPEIGFANAVKQTGKTELKKKKSPRKHKKSKSRKNSKKRKSSKKRKEKKKKYSSKKRKGNKRKGSKRKKGAGKKKYSRKYSKRKGNRKGKRYSKRHGRRTRGRRTHIRRNYSSPTNNGSVEYRNYKRNTDADNQSKENIDKIAPSKEIKKEPKKEGE